MNELPTPRHEQENDIFTTVTTVMVQSQSALETLVQEKLNDGYTLEGVAMDVGHYIAVFSRTVTTG